MNQETKDPLPPSGPITWIASFARVVRSTWTAEVLWGFQVPLAVRQAAQNFANVLELWANQLASEQARNRRAKLKLVVDDLAHPGPECSCTNCMRNPDYL